MNIELMPFKGSSNFRDLLAPWAGMGVPVPTGVLYRADALRDFTDSDLDLFQRLGIKTVLDLRSELERQHAPDRLPEQVSVHHIPVYDSKLGLSLLAEMAEAGTLTAEASKRMMERMYLSFLEDFTQEFRSIFQILLDTRHWPAVVHCTAGKDRTGFSAAVLQWLCGFDRKSIVVDFMATNRFFDSRTEERLTTFADQINPDLDPEAVRPMFVARESYLLTALDYIQKEFHSPEEYLIRSLGIEPALVQEFKTTCGVLEVGER